MLAPWNKVITNLDSLLKSETLFCWQRPSAQSYGFSSSHVWVWELDYKESWAPKNWCFWIVMWKRLLRVPWTARRSNQSILKEISPEYSLEGRMLKLKLQYFGHLMQRTDSLGKTLMLGKIEDGRRSGDNRGWDGWMASLTQWTWLWVNSGSWWWTGRPGMLQSTRSQRVGNDWSTELNWRFQLKLEEEHSKSKGSRREAIIKIRAKINAITWTKLKFGSWKY